MTATIRRPYWKVGFHVAVAWWCVSGLTMVASWAIAPSPLAGLSLGGVVWIALGSGVVAAMAIAPGLIVTVADSAHDQESLDSASGDLSQSSDVERVGQAFLAGMLIRLAGTVALFMASSYYLDPSDADSVLASIAGSPFARRIAIWVLGWHAILLLTEVVSLVREIKQ